jgi:hypothetical protein
MGGLKIGRKELLQVLNDAERRFPVNTWRIGEIYVWPIIKIDLFFRHVKVENHQKDFVENTQVRKPSFLNSIFQVLYSLLSYWVLVLSSHLFKTKVNVLFSDSFGHRVWLKDKYINRYFEPLITEFIKEDNNFKSITLNDDLADQDKYPSSERIFFTSNYIRGAKLVGHLFRRHPKQYLPDFDDFVGLFDKDEFYYLKVNKYKDWLVARCLHVVSLERIVRAFLRKYEPNVIFELCYYSSLRFAINLASRKKGIKTIEMQHGGMGHEHVSYANWSNVPELGFNVLPNTFWVWDDASGKLLNSWIEKKGNHSVIVGGNPWLGYVDACDDTKYEFIEGKTIILYTMQYREIEEYILDAIALSPEAYQWWVRLHPRKTDAKFQIESKLKEMGIANKVEITKATEYPLPIILKKSAVHLSGSSGSIIEAAQLGVPSLILTKLGADYYQSIIQSGRAFPVLEKSSQVLLSKICDIERKVEPKDDMIVNLRAALNNVLR